jgi:hypothetical protein
MNLKRKLIYCSVHIDFSNVVKTAVKWRVSTDNLPEDGHKEPKYVK